MKHPFGAAGGQQKRFDLPIEKVERIQDGVREIEAPSFETKSGPRSQVDLDKPQRNETQVAEGKYHCRVDLQFILFGFSWFD